MYDECSHGVAGGLEVAQPLNLWPRSSPVSWHLRFLSSGIEVLKKAVPLVWIPASYQVILSVVVVVFRFTTVVAVMAVDLWVPFYHGGVCVGGQSPPHR